MAEALAMDAADELGGNREPALNKYFKAVIRMQVSDLHLKASRPAYVRMKGDLRPLTGGPLTGEQIRAGIFELLNEDQKQLFHDNGAVDFAHDVGSPGDNDRFRVNAFLQRGKMSVAARRVNRNILKFHELCLLPEGSISASTCGGGWRRGTSTTRRPTTPLRTPTSSRWL